MTGDGRALIVRFTDSGGWHRWALTDPAIGEICRSRLYVSRQAAEDEARTVFGGWLGESPPIDMERGQGIWERLR